MIEWLERETPLGRIFLAGSERGLCRLTYSQGAGEETAWLKSRFPQEEVLPAPAGERSLVHQAAGQLDEYLAGRRRSFDLALDLNGTAFQKKVWQTLLALPYGTTISYSALAARAGFPGAARAVGAAMRANPLAIVVPCHRVLKANGGLGCYAGGQAHKRFLLRLEGVPLQE